jgi:hypothetical protein
VGFDFAHRSYQRSLTSAPLAQGINDAVPSGLILPWDFFGVLYKREIGGYTLDLRGGSPGSLRLAGISCQSYSDQ